MRMLRSHRKVQTISKIVAAFLGYFTLSILYFPIIWLILMSFSGEPLSTIPGDFTLKWYNALIDNNSFRIGQPVFLSLCLAVFTGLACAACALLVGRVLPKIQGGWPYLLLFLLPLFIPGIVLGAGMFMYYRLVIGVKMGMWSLALAHFVWAFPFALLCMLIVSSRFDPRLLEAAADLGASRWRQFRDIEFPLMKPGIFAGAFFSFLLSFNELPRSIFMRSGELTLPLFLWIQSGSHDSTIPLIYAMSALITVASLAISVIAIRMMISGD
ncbi:ABC transporter permease subunit [Ruegeria sp. 2012CJ41-6]|uniref:ABC transporter permease subunit n=1 Tax=Ruegeria spongiae TaxID=2942209 RepID=A0ABT0Q5I8_9RHOB|nr:ABC transporter permease subunit [Ruegeria spongiae]MCL6285075.1 ABC transporter permease subunit [Ruegeria spongiae]